MVLVDHVESGLASTTPNPTNRNENCSGSLSNCSGCLLSNLWLAMTELSPQEVDQVKVHDQV